MNVQTNTAKINSRLDELEIERDEANDSEFQHLLNSPSLDELSPQVQLETINEGFEKFTIEKNQQIDRGPRKNAKALGQHGFYSTSANQNDYSPILAIESSLTPDRNSQTQNLGAA